MANYTQHYGLHQWEPEDPFLRTDFNEDFQKIDAALEGVAVKTVNVVSGSYIGTGEYGEAAPNQLSLPFVPALVILVADAVRMLASGTVFLRGQNYSAGIGVAYSDWSALNLTVSWNENTLSWYCEDAGDQLNKEGITYRYFALA